MFWLKDQSWYSNIKNHFLMYKVSIMYNVLLKIIRWCTNCKICHKNNSYTPHCLMTLLCTISRILYFSISPLLWQIAQLQLYSFTYHPIRSISRLHKWLESVTWTIPTNKSTCYQSTIASLHHNSNKYYRTYKLNNISSNLLK